MTILNRKIIVAGCVLMVAQAASAGYVVNVSQVVDGAGFTGGAANLVGYSSYAVSVSSTAGEIIASVDATFTGPMHQAWTGTTTADPTPIATLAGNTSGDTAMTPISPDITLPPLEPTENNNVTPSPLADTFVSGSGGYDFGNGDTLSGAWGVPGSDQGTSTPVAYLVIPGGESVGYSIEVADANDINAPIVVLTGTIESSFSVLFGDADNNLQVDINDIFAVQQNLGNSGPSNGLLLGDSDDNGQVDINDIFAVQQNLGASVSSASAQAVHAVPVPATATMLAAIGGLALLRRRRLY